MKLDTPPRIETATTAEPGRVVPIALDAAQIVANVFPALSLRGWRELDARGKCPRGFFVGKRKLWRITDLEQWAAFGFPSRAEYEARCAHD